MTAATPRRADAPTRPNVRTYVPRRALPLARKAYDVAAPFTSRWRMLPDFIVIGGQRCGTTSVFKALAEHPQVIRPPVDKGTEYYSMRYTKDLDWYRSRFPLRRLAERRTADAGPPMTFEANTYYLFHPFAIERLAKDFPDIKLVVMLRDPVERAFSSFKHESARGYETEPDFLRALQLEDQRLAGLDERLAEPGFTSLEHRHHAYRRRGEFANQLRRVFAHYPADQVHVMDSKAFFDEPATEFAALTDFLDLQPWQPRTFDQHNPSARSPMPEDARRFLEDHLRPHDDDLAQLLSRPLNWVRP
jgi:hypothetical protein